MLFRGNPINFNCQNAIMYLPKHNHVPAQDSQQCYYFSFLHLLTMHGNQDHIPSCVKEIVDACKNEPDKDREIMIDRITAHADDFIYIADEILDDEGSDYEGDWVQDIVDKYGVDLTMARLLNLTVKAFEDENFDKNTLTMTQLKTILITHGPIGIGLIRGNDLTNEKLSVSETVQSSSEAIKRNIYNVDHYSADTPHFILLIGCESQAAQQVYFIDPVYPAMILSMNFKLFKENILTPEFVHINENKLKPDAVIFSHENKKRERDHASFDNDAKRFKRSPS